VDTKRLQQAIDAADLRVLLVCLFHRTGDHRWLEAPYLPARDVRLVADPQAGFAPETQREIREAAVELFADPAPPSITDPGDDLILKMMRSCLGENVAPEYSLLMREELGFTSRDNGLHLDPGSPSPIPDVLIVGAGVSGIALGAQLTRLGIPYAIVEKNAEVGGTWWENRYPGCGVDTPNHSYSFSHGNRPRWTRYFSLRDEIQNYLVNCSSEFGVRDRIRFETKVIGASWNTTTQQWTVRVETSKGAVETLHARILVTAVGVLNSPKLPSIDGIDDFAGQLFHSARWPDGVNLAGKHVAVIGTGASSMQLTPTIADEVRSLTIYQRSPQWARDIDGYRSDIGEESQWLFEHVPYYLEWFRFTMWWRYGDGLLRHLRKDPDWPYPDRATNRVNDRHRQEMADFITRELDGRPDLIDKCMPTYPPYGKRILIDNGWFSTLCKPQVELVTSPISRITRTGVESEDGTTRDVDVIVVATGFQTTQLAARLNITGQNGTVLADVWADDNPRAYIGMTVPEFPNMFCMLGPNTALGHGGSTIFMSECQARYIVSCIKHMHTNGLGSLEVQPDVHDEYNAKIDAEHELLIWTHPGMTNWYRNKHNRITALLPWRLVDYWTMTHDPNFDDFRVVPVASQWQHETAQAR
jgi:4-hydroxyacetophenone monooxygenase